MYLPQLVKTTFTNIILTNKSLKKNLCSKLTFLKKFKLARKFGHKNVECYKKSLKVLFCLYKAHYAQILSFIPVTQFKLVLLLSFFGRNQKLKCYVTALIDCVALKKKKGGLLLAKSPKGGLINFILIKDSFNTKQNQVTTLLSLSKKLLKMPWLVKKNTILLRFKHFTQYSSKFILKIMKKRYFIALSSQFFPKPYNGCRPKKEKRRKLH